jgi:hypothetical protein
MYYMGQKKKSNDSNEFIRRIIGAIAILLFATFLIKSGAWNWLSTEWGLGNPNPVLSMGTVPETPKTEAKEAETDSDGLKRFDPSKITDADLERYKGALSMIGTDVEIKPADNSDSWASVGGREKQFGAAWKDIDKNGCDTRNDILWRDISAYDRGSIVYGDSKKCVVLSGKLYDPYTDKVLDFKRGKETSSLVQIDHIIPLHLAWQEGAKQWTQEKREQLANDSENLIAVEGKANNTKSDGYCGKLGCDINANSIFGDPEDKLYQFYEPPNRNYRCEYTYKEVVLHKGYGLWLIPDEATTYKTVLTACVAKESIDGVFGL